MNEDDKDMAGKSDYERELTELLNLLETVDQQITPQHIDDRFSELLKNVEDDSETPDNVVTGEFSQSVSDEIPAEYADDSRAVESFQVSDKRDTPFGDLIDFVAVAEYRRAGCDEGVALVKAAYDEAARIVAAAREDACDEAMRIIARSQQKIQQLKAAAASHHDRAHQILADAQLEADEALIRAASMTADARRQAEQILDKAREDASAIIKFAREEAAEIHAAAQQEQQQAASAEIDASHVATVDALQALPLLVLRHAALEAFAGEAPSPTSPDVSSHLLRIRRAYAAGAAGQLLSLHEQRCTDHGIIQRINPRVSSSVVSGAPPEIRESVPSILNIGCWDSADAADMRRAVDVGELSVIDTDKRGHLVNWPSSGSVADNFTCSEEGAWPGQRLDNRTGEVFLASTGTAIIIAITAVLASISGAPGVRMSTARPASLQTRSTAPAYATPGAATSGVMDITFASGTSEFADPAHTANELATIAGWLRVHPAGRVSIGGYTDDAGSGAYNGRLSLERAELIRSTLIELGAPAGSVQLVSGGGQLQSGWSEEGVFSPASSLTIILTNENS